MTATEKYKRAESLFQDKTKRELANMVVHREADLEDARAENAKLQNDADLLRLMLQAKRKDTHALMSENAELREQLAKARDPQRIGGQADPSSFVYTIEQLREFRWQHATNDEEAIPYINNVADAHERENAKLRELLSVMAYCNQFRRDCDGCSMNGAAGIITERAGCDELLARLRELGVEAD